MMPQTGTSRCRWVGAVQRIKTSREITDQFNADFLGLKTPFLASRSGFRGHNYVNFYTLLPMPTAQIKHFSYNSLTS